MPLPPDALAAHRHLVYGYALRLLGNEHDAADVTQEVLVRLWRQGDIVAPERRRAWALRVTRNACIDHHRSRTTSTSARETLDHDHAICSDSLPDRDAEQSDFRARLEMALCDLDEPYRSIVILREIEGLAYQEIAEALELPLNTIKVYLHRGRARLREALRTLIPTDDLSP